MILSKKTIHSKIVSALFVPTALVGLLLMGILLWNGKAALDTSNQINMTDKVDNYAFEVESLIQSAEGDSSAIKNYAEKVFLPLYWGGTERDQKNALQDFEKIILSLSTHSYTNYFVNFAPNLEALPENLGAVHYEDIDGIFKTLETKESLWYGPYTPAKGLVQNEVLTYALPIIYNQQIVAIAGVDVSTERLTQELSVMHFYKSGYVALVDEQLRFISHPDLRLGKTLTEQLGEKYRDLETELSSGTSGQIQYVWVSGVKKVLFYKQLSNGWRLILTAHQKEVYADQNTMTLEIGILYLAVLLFILLATTLLAHCISQPLKRLIHALNDGSNWQMNQLENLATQKDEIGTLSQLLLNRLELDASYMTNVQNYNENLEAMVLAKNQDLIAANKALTEKRELVQAHQKTLKTQNAELETSIQNMIATQRQLIEQEKNLSFTAIAAQISEEIKPSLRRANDWIQQLQTIGNGLLEQVNQHRFSRAEFLDAYQKAQKTNRRLISHMVYSRDVIDYVKDLAANPENILDDLIDLRDYVKKAESALNTSSLDPLVSLDVSKFKSCFVHIDSAKFLHLLESLLLHMAASVSPEYYPVPIRSALEVTDLTAVLSFTVSTTQLAESISPSDLMKVSSQTSHMGISMIKLLTREAFGGKFLTSVNEAAQQLTYTLSFPDTIIPDIEVDTDRNTDHPSQ